MIIGRVTLFITLVPTSHDPSKGPFWVYRVLGFLDLINKSFRQVSG